MPVVPNLAQVRHVYYTDLYTSYIGRTLSHLRSHLRYILHHSLCMTQHCQLLR